MNAYTDRQQERDRQYTDAYRQWLGSVPFEQQQKLAQLGLDKPDCSYIGNGRTHDITELSIAIEDTENSALPIERVGADDARAAGELLREFLFRIIDENENPRLEAECISLAFGFGAARGLTQTAVAERYGVTRAAVSKRVREIKRDFNLPASEFMKSDRAAATYRLTNKAKV